RIPLGHLYLHRIVPGLAHRRSNPWSEATPLRHSAERLDQLLARGEAFVDRWDGGRSIDVDQGELGATALHSPIADHVCHPASVWLAGEGARAVAECVVAYVQTILGEERLGCHCILRDLIHLRCWEIRSAVPHIGDLHHQVSHHFALNCDAPGEDAPGTIVRV